MQSKGKGKKRSKKSLRAEVDKLIGANCRKLGHCEICGKTTHLQWVHFITRRIILLRYDKRNYGCICAGCHMYGHQHPSWMTYQWERIKGSGTTVTLEQESNKVEPIKDEFYLNIILSLKGGQL